MYSVIMGHLGSDAVAANSIASIVKNLAGCFCMGLGNGGGIMSGLVLLAFSPLILRAANLSVTAEGYLKGMLLICAYYTGRGWLCKELVFIRIKNIFVWSFSVCED